MTINLCAGVGPWETHVERLQAAGQSRRTIEARLSVISRLACELDVPLIEATTADLAAWLACPDWARATRSIYRYHIRAYYSWMAAEGVLDRDPSRDLARVRIPRGQPRPVSEDDLTQILARTRDPRWRLYIVLAAYAGLRCEEIARLYREHITEDTITVRGKGDKARRVPTHPSVWELVCDLPPGQVVHLGGGDPVAGAKALSRGGSAWMARIGHKGVTMHMLRHRFGTQVYRRSRNLRAVQELLGHASIATTQGYTQVDDEERRLAVHTLPAAA